MFDRLKGMLGAQRVQAGGAPHVPRVQAMAAPAATYQATDGRSPQGAAYRVAEAPPNVAAMQAPELRSKARDLIRNSGWARQIVGAFVDDAVGWGPEPLIVGDDPAKAEALAERWRAWEPFAFTEGRSFADGIAAAVQALVVDGEVFVRVRPRLKDDLPAGVVPIQFELCPAEMCPQTESGDSPEGIVDQGIVLDKKTRQVVGYRFLAGIPGDSPVDTASVESKFWPAASVFHLVAPDRIKARRGVSHLAAALVPLSELQKFANALRVRANIATHLVATYKPAPVEASIDPLTGEVLATAGSEPVLELYPGGVNQLSSDKESLEITPPADFPVGYGEFLESGLREAGAALGVPLERFSHRWGATNDRLARVVLNDWRRRIDRFVWGTLVPRLLDPLWRAWITRAALVGDTADAKLRAEWMQHGFPYVHPVQDVQAIKAALDAGLISPQEAIAVRGGQLRVVYQQIAQAAELARSLGLDFTAKNGGSK